MIQLNTASLFGKQDSSNSMLPSSTETQDGNSFEKALTASIAANLHKFGIATNNATVPSAVAAPEASTVTSVTLPSAPATSGADAVSPFAAAATSVTPPVTPSPTGPDLPAPPASNDPSGDSTQSFDDAYWAAQPAAVQQLRNMDDYTERSQMAAQLTAQGYNIDVPIMVYGWDPAKITAARESYGYTWVPSAMQKPVSEAPGVSTPGGQAYDPNHAPSGSIAV
jgi:hypothetical protein